MTEVLKYASNVEKAIVEKLIDRALANAWTVSVWDGYYWSIRNCLDKQLILENMNSTDSDILSFRHNGFDMGKVLLIWGNEEDLISDHTYNKNMRELVEGL